MNALSVEAFELRAKEAEERLHLLEKKVASKSGGGIGGEKLSAILAVLYKVRATLGTEKNRQSLDERNRIALENRVKELEEQNSKLQYQVLHLKRNLQERM